MFEKVLVPTDFSIYAQKVIDCISQIPGVKEAVLLNVVARDPLARTWDPVAEMRDAQARLDEQARRMNIPGITIKTRAMLDLEGNIPGDIQRAAEEEGATLVAMGAHGKGIIENFLLGSVTRGVLRYGDEHLLIMRYKALDRRAGPDLEDYCSHLFERVLVPTDFSEPARVAVSLLTKMPRVRDIILLHVITKGESREEVEARGREAVSTIQAMITDPAMKGLSIRPITAVGNAAREINAVAERENASLIAISSTGKDSPKWAMVGSTAYDVANNATRPVFVVRSSKPPYV